MFEVKVTPQASKDLLEIKNYIDGNIVRVIRIKYSKRDFIRILFEDK